MKRNLLLIGFMFFFSTLYLSAQVVSVTFKVDMRVKTIEGTFKPANSQLFLRGSMNGWGSTAMDAGTDTTYSVKVDSLHPGDTLYFKYFYNNPDTWENDPNRTFIVPATNGSVFSDNFDRDSVINLTGDGNVTFAVDLTGMTQAGVYFSNQDSAEIRGSFNGWNDADHPRTYMNQKITDDNQWYLNVPFVSQPLHEDMYYKFFVKTGDSNRLAIFKDGYERPLSTGGGNRTIKFDGTTTQDAGSVYFDDVTPDYVIASGTNASIKFRVDMTDAMDVNKQPIPFDPSKDQVYWSPRQASFLFTQGFPTDTSGILTYKMEREGTTNIYSGPITPKAPTFNGFLYIYGFRHFTTTDTTWIYEPTGFSNFAYRVRYIKQTGPNAFVQPYSAPVDTWTNAEVKKNDQEASPFTAVQNENNGLVNGFKLNQNYPNPFNPSTTISFSVPKAGIVTLKVYNLLGQEVATLVNQELAVNTYKVNFDAKRLTSGIYFYTIKAGDFTATKKMILLK